MTSFNLFNPYELCILQLDGTVQRKGLRNSPQEAGVMDKCYGDLLEGNLSELCDKMVPSQVTSRLVKQGVFKDYDVQMLDSIVTKRHKNEYIINSISERGFSALTKFLCALSSIDHAHSALAERIQPVRNRITWFSAMPAHAAAVVYALEKYAGAKFSGMKRVGRNKVLVGRRARIFPKEYDEKNTPALDLPERAKHAHKTEVCLLFPATPTPADAAESALESWFAEGLGLDADTVVMGGAYEGEAVGERGRAVVATRCSYGEEEARGGLTEVEFESLEAALSESLSNLDERPPWLEEFANAVPEVKFCKMCCQSPTGDETRSTETASRGEVMVTDSLPFLFYKLCRQHCPGKRSLLCQGGYATACATSDGERDLSPAQPLDPESTAALRSSCVLLEICKHYYYPENTDQRELEVDSDD